MPRFAQPTLRHSELTPEPSLPPVPDWSSLRSDFPALDQTIHGAPLIYLDNAATTQKPRSVLASLNHHYSHDNANVHRGLHELSHRATLAYEAARTRVAHFLGAADPGEIIFTRGTTESVNLVANAWGRSRLKVGDVILLTEMEHHSNLVPWQLLANRTGARLEFVPVTGDEGLLDLSNIDELLTAGVKLFSFVHVSNSLGTINPAQSLCERARRAGVITLVDAAQSAGHMPIDVQDLGCDFLAFSGHKTCGPTGIGVLFGRRELLDAMPPWQGGGEMIREVHLRSASYKPPPHRFEAGTPPIAEAIGLACALDYLDHLGRSHLLHHDQALALRTAERIAALPGVRVFGPPSERAGIVSFALAGIHPHDFVTFADQRGLALRAGHHCTQPLMRRLGIPATSRASFFLYNTISDSDALADTVAAALDFFGC